MTPHLVALAVGVALGGAPGEPAQPDPPAPSGARARVVMPASGVVIEGLPTGVVARWEVEGTLLVGARNAQPVDRLLGWSDANERLVTIEVRHHGCPALDPVTASPWPTLGFAGIRSALPERRAVQSCKMPDLQIELRFPAGTATEDGDVESLLLEANKWESVVAALHAAYGMTHIDLMGATTARGKLSLEAAEGAPDGSLAQLAAPLALRSGQTFERAGDQLPWLVRDIGGHDMLTLLAPTGAALGLQLLPFERRFHCTDAMAAALKSQPAAPPGTPDPRLPPGWQSARAVGTEGAAFCVDGSAGGLVAIGGARVPRDEWLPIAAPILGRIGEIIAR